MYRRICIVSCGVLYGYLLGLVGFLWFKSSIYLLFFCLVVLAIIETEVLKYLTVLLNCLHLPLILSYFALWILEHCICSCYVFGFNWCFYHYIISLQWHFCFKVYFAQRYYSPSALLWLLFVLAYFSPFSYAQTVCIFESEILTLKYGEQYIFHSYF